MSDILDDPPNDRIVCDTRSWSCSEVEVLKHEFFWTIENFSQLPINIDSQEAIQSHAFDVGQAKEHVFLIRMYPFGKKYQRRNYIGLFLGLLVTNAGFDGIYVKFQMTITNSEGKTLQSRSKEGHFQSGTFRGWPRFADRSEVLKYHVSTDLLKDQLIIRCEISFSRGCIKHQFEGADDEVRNSLYEIPTCRLAKDLVALLHTKTASDLTLVVNKETIEVHKAILTARSPVFAAMFGHEMEESMINRLQIKNFKTETVRAMIHFIYSGSIGIQPIDVSKELIIASNKYDLPRLKVICENNLAFQLSVTNICDLLVIADENKCEKLKGFALQFLKNNCKKVQETEGWKNMVHSKQNLMQDILKMLVSINTNIQGETSD